MITLESFRGSSCSVGDPVDGKDTTSGLVEPESVGFFFLLLLGLFSVCSEQGGTLLLAVHGLLVAVASLAAEHRL